MTELTAVSSILATRLVGGGKRRDIAQVEAELSCDSVVSSEIEQLE